MADLAEETTQVSRTSTPSTGGADGLGSIEKTTAGSLAIAISPNVKRALMALAVLLGMIVVAASTILILSAVAPSALPAGPRGEAGVVGAPGPKGIRGPRGPRGRTGVAGAQGAPGATTSRACSDDTYGPGANLPYC